MIKHEESIYSEVLVARDKVCKYLRMVLDFRTKGELRIHMFTHTGETTEMFPEEITETETIPAANHVFTINPDIDKLGET